MRFDEYYFQEAKLDNWEELKSQSDELRATLKVIKKLNENGFEALIVGGAVRDFVLGKMPADFDITTNATPDQVEKIFGKVHDIGKNKLMGVSIVKQDGFTMEVATFRTDSYNDLTKGLGADKVELTTSFKDDSSRRDLTINALGVDVDGNIIDHHNGLDHIKNKIISTVGDPNLRFKEDQVRSLRSIRFASRLGFQIDQKTIDAIKSNAPEIKKVASERVLKEITKMAEQSGTKFAEAIVMLKNVNLLKYILPEIDIMDSYEHSKEHHPEGNVFSHVIAALRSYKGNDPVVNFAILFHDVGKPESYKNEEGKHTYHGHAGMSRRTLESLASRLHMDNEMRDAIIFAAENHMKFHDIQKMSNNTIAQLMQSPYWEVLKQVSEADAKSRGEKFNSEEWEKTIGKTKDIESKFAGKKAIDAVKKVVNGRWVMELTGMTQKDGPKIGKTINTTVEWILDNSIDLEDKDKIANFIKGIKL